MKRTFGLQAASFLVVASAVTSAVAQELERSPLPIPGATKVTPENYMRAETDFAFAGFQDQAGGKINHFFYIRKPTPLDE
jgi:hypothetical protein